ncbi:AmmeMemoRadiSam system protein A [Parasulfuritortus cantonensis]|uniref:AmmeMemoRadiSam system protein A n=1 Tax=Parasulfuritortus cantonensis TaxID=2528202 RepID=A0A4R1B9D3_9PROT|nr:AmmeMemoRadiSam system protein A [Parasulfuritortus cantonensis]TCJ13508.1 AmmeMemoRadiSam system protein A [Parasulfuritortus cantonensis]
MTRLPETPDKGALLTAIARAAIARKLGQPAAMAATRPDWLASPGAVFVTLTQAGQLRGCIGSLEAWRPLADDLEANARAAAFGDPRFPALAAEELARTRVEVSILSKPEPLPCTDEADAVAKLRPGVDGVILEWHRHRGTFLPQVWDQLPTPASFLRHLKQKAGLPADFWADDVRLSRYTVEKFKEAP